MRCKIDLWWRKASLIKTDLPVLITAEVLCWLHCCVHRLTKDILFVTTLCFAVLQGALAGSEVLIVEGPSTKNLGIFKDSESPVAEFTVVNSGKEALKITQILKTCGCNSAWANIEGLKPGEKAIVSVKIEPYTLDGPFSKSVFVLTEPAQSKHLPLTVTGESIPLFRIHPSTHINAGKLQNGAEWKGSIEIVSKSPVVFGKPVVTSDCPTLVDLTIVAEKSWKLPIKLTAPTNSKFRCEISLPVIEPANRPPLVFQLSGRAGTELIAIPSTLLIFEDGACIKTVQLKIIGKRGRMLKPEELNISPVTEGLSFKAAADREGSLTAFFTLAPALTGQISVERPMELTVSVPDAAPATLIFSKEIQHTKLP